MKEISKSDLERLHHIEKKGINTISKLYGKSYYQIQKLFDEYQIERLNRSQLKLPQKLPSKNELENLYLENQYSIVYISKLYNTTKRTISNLIVNYDIPKRSVSENRKLSEKEIQKTNNKRYGVNHASQNQTIANRIGESNSKIKVNLNNDDLIKMRKNELTQQEIADNFGVAQSTIGLRLKDLGMNFTVFRSSYERIIENFVRNQGINNIESGSNIINRYEIDVYLPDDKLAIEINGVYWHTEQKGKHKKYHLNKTQLCENKNIQLLHIFENEIKDSDKFDIWKSIILNKINKTPNRIYARNCIVKKITNVKDFLNQNHLQGHCQSSYNIGLYYNDELVSVMTFGKSRYNNNYEWELLRYVNKKYTTVIGGASKLLKFFINNKKPQSIISYSDLRYSNGNLYRSLGFEYSHRSQPNYWYVINNQLESRLKYQKHKLKNKLSKFDKNLTEYENMLMNGYDRIWDCGNDVWVLVL